MPRYPVNRSPIGAVELTAGRYWPCACDEWHIEIQYTDVDEGMIGVIEWHSTDCPAYNSIIEENT